VLIDYSFAMHDIRTAAHNKHDKVEFECKANVDDAEPGLELKDNINSKISAGDRGLGVTVQYDSEG
jgi:hypothetical protein